MPATLEPELIDLDLALPPAEADAAFRQLCVTIVNGDKPSRQELMTTLANTGRTPADLASAIRRLRAARQAQEQLVQSPASNVEAETIRQQIEANDTAQREAKEAFEKRINELFLDRQLLALRQSKINHDGGQREQAARTLLVQASDRRLASFETLLSQHDQVQRERLTLENNLWRLDADGIASRLEAEQARLKELRERYGEEMENEDIRKVVRTIADLQQRKHAAEELTVQVTKLLEDQKRLVAKINTAAATVYDWQGAELEG